ncbi:hypothetical protein GCM10007977_078840 [Dactylosporangium sucinum]|uniref:DUF2997 domain-containing protein n=2 Tax=Dactylosporangium sucinum TaxID=1424081 RepID=A0A917U7W0_9ACTN|nr:hypothetical protein GCM10007977_078840 [Dactylosporangium sucinum]
MADRPRIIVTVSSDGTVNAQTEGVHGGACLDYIAVLEDLLEARTVDSTYTADYTRTTTAQVQTAQQDRNIERA